MGCKRGGGRKGHGLSGVVKIAYKGERNRGAGKVNGCRCSIRDFLLSIR